MSNELMITDPMKEQKLKMTLDMLQPAMKPEQIKEELDIYNGQAKNSRHNCRLILENDHLLKGAFRYNLLTDHVDIVKELWWSRSGSALTDIDMSFIMMYLEETYGISIDKTVNNTISYVSYQDKFHPIQEYLNALQWDGNGRIRTILHKYLGCDTSDLTYESLKMMLLGAINRIFNPSCKFDYMFCIVGGQGVGKSSFFRLLAIKDEWFTDDLKNLGDENVYRKMRGHWIIEMSEMIATTTAKSIEEIKSFLSRQKEVYKDPYAIHPMDRPRQCVFCGSSNKKRFLPFDRTGNRRFVPIEANTKEAEVHILANEEESRKEIDQLWAEAMTIYRKGDYSLAFTPEIEAQLDELRKDYMAEDTEAGMIQGWLDDYTGSHTCSRQLYAEALGNSDKPKKSETDRICDIMNTSIIGWEKGPMHRFPVYGKQRSWVRSPVNEDCKPADGLADPDGFQSLEDAGYTQMELPFQ